MSVDTYSVSLSIQEDVHHIENTQCVSLCIGICCVYLFPFVYNCSEKKKTSKQFSSKEERLQATHHFSVCLYIIIRGQQQYQAYIFAY